MKKIIYLLGIALIGLNLACNKEELIMPSEESNEWLTDSENVDIIHSKPKGNAGSSNIAKSMSGTGNGIFSVNGVPAGVEALVLYMDMDLIQSNYTASYTGSFSQHYRNEMSAHFAIYSVQYAQSHCGNIERWFVHKEEYEKYTGTTDAAGVISLPIGTDSGNDNTTASDPGGSTTTGWGDDNGNVSQIPPNRPIDPDDQPKTNTGSIPVPIGYDNCF